MTQSLQDRFAPHNACFGCGPANAKGLRLKSIPPAEPGGEAYAQALRELFDLQVPTSDIDPAAAGEVHP